ncbi:MAG: DUF2231 domain-containing protein [Sphingobium sp.]
MQTQTKIVRSGPNALHAILLGFPIALFSANLATDITYLRTEEIQWTNFSAWLNAGGLVFGGLVLAWALVSLLLGIRGGDRLRRSVYASLLALMCIVGLANAFQHSRDGWSSVGTFGLTLSIVTVLLALAAGLVAHSSLFSREVAR